MVVIAINNGPDQNGMGIFHLTKGKEYEVVSYGIAGKTKLKKNEEIYVPKEFKFYIEVIADDNIVRSFWNDYFLSTLEMSKINRGKLNNKLKKIKRI